MHVGIYETVKVIKEDQEKKISIVENKITKSYVIERIIKRGEMNIYQQLLGIHNPHWPTILEIQKNRVYEEYIDAPKLSELESVDIKNVVLQLCEALEALHTMQPPIVHRDIKPDNIFIDQGRVLLFDFDIARNVVLNQSQDTELLGSVGYASPEQYGFGQSDVRSDIYALGILLKEYDKEGIYQSISNRASALDPKDRYQSAKELKEELLHCKLWLIPGIVDMTSLKKIRSLLLIILMLGVVFSSSTKTKEIPILYPMLLFFYQYMILFLWDNRKRWPKKKRLAYCVGIYFLVIFVATAIYQFVRNCML